MMHREIPPALYEGLTGCCAGLESGFQTQPDEI